MSETSGKAVGAPRLGNVPEVKAVCVQKAVADVVDSVVYRCGGRVLWGPSNDSVLQLSGWFLVLGFSSVYFGFCAERIWEDLSPGWVVLIAVLDAVLIYCYFVACFREPGIIPSRQVRELGEAQRPGFKAEMAEVLEKEAQSDSVYHKSFHLAKYAEAAWCGTCMVARPSLSTHCRQCDHCVSVWDHHCNWVGNCIGARNHRQFIGFLLSASLLSVFLPTSLAVYMFTQGMEDSQMTTVSCVLIALSCLVAVFVLSMTQLHLKIVSKGQTLKMSEKQAMIGFPKLGWDERLSNLWGFFWRHTPRESVYPASMKVPIPERARDIGA